MPNSVKARRTEWFIEAVIAVNVLYLSGSPLLADERAVGFGGDAIGEGFETFLTGVGPYTLAFWLRILSIVAAVVILLAFPTKANPKRWIRARCLSNFTLAMLFFWVVGLSIIFGTFSDYLWLQPVTYAAIMSIAYLSNSWWSRERG